MIKKIKSIIVEIFLWNMIFYKSIYQEMILQLIPLLFKIFFRAKLKYYLIKQTHPPRNRLFDWTLT